MGKGSEDTNPVGTKYGGWIKCADGYWRTEMAASGKTFSRDTKSAAMASKPAAPTAPTAATTAAENSTTATKKK